MSSLEVPSAMGGHGLQYVHSRTILFGKLSADDVESSYPNLNSRGFPRAFIREAQRRNLGNMSRLMILIEITANRGIRRMKHPISFARGSNLFPSAVANLHVASGTSRTLITLLVEIEQGEGHREFIWPPPVQRYFFPTKKIPW